MPKSGFVFEAGEAIDVGEHGNSDYVYASGSPVTDEGISSLVYESGNGLRGVSVIVDDFEDGDVSEYNKESATTIAAQSSVVYEGNYALQITGVNVDIQAPVGALNYEPSRGDVLEYYVYLPEDFTAMELNFASQSSGVGSENHYEAALKSHDRTYSGTDAPNANGSVQIAKRKDNNWAKADLAGSPLPQNEWIRGIIEFGSSDITITAYTQENSSTFTNEWATATITDTEWDSGGIGWSNSQGINDPDDTGDEDRTSYGDFARKIGTV